MASKFDHESSTLLTRAVSSGTFQSLFDLAVTDWGTVASDDARTTLEAHANILRDSAVSTDDRIGPLRLGDELAVLRRHPFVSTRIAEAAPTWTSGLAVTRRVGPIIDSLGRPLWIDLFRRVRQLRFVRTPGGTPLLALPIVQARFALSGAPLRAGQLIRIPAGSVWFATGLVSAAPTTVMTGLRIAGGSLRLSADVNVVGDEVVVPTAVSIELSVDLEAPERSSSRPNSEFAKTRFEPPKRLHLSIRSGSAQMKVDGKARLEVWGRDVVLKPETIAPQYRADLNRLIVPMAPLDRNFTIEDVTSTHFIPAKVAKIADAGWALPAAVIAPTDLGDAEGVGALMLAFEPGLTATWRGEPNPVALGAALLLLDGARLAFSAGAPAAGGRGVKPAMVHASAPAQLHYSRINRSPVHYFTGTDGIESLVQTALVDLRLSRPVDVRGDRVSAHLPAAQVVLGHDPAAGDSLMLIGLAQVRSGERPLAFGLTNAVLRTSSPRVVLMIGRFDDAGAIVEGGTFVAYELGGLLPSLPDPYAANASLSQRFGAARQGLLVSAYRFSPGGEGLEFLLPPGAGIDLSGLASTTTLAETFEQVPRQQTHINAAAWPPRDSIGHGGDMFDFEQQPRIVLLDVSSNAGRFGVALRPPRPEWREEAKQWPLRPPTVQGLDLVVDGRLLVLLTLPAVQWEPVRALPGPEPFPDEVRFANSGVPTTIDVPSVALVPVNPLTAYRTILNNFATPQPRLSRARFTLPFGMVANARLSAPGSDRGARVSEARPVAGDLEGAHQLRLEAVDPRLPAHESPALPGFVAQLSVAIPNGGAPTSILGNSVTTIFNGDLGLGGANPLVPVTRIDLSGHGESLFSQWANPDDPPVGVAKVEFQVLNGRAAHEVVQVKSFLLPYFVPVVRTITLERKGNAVFTRHDSGWVAVRDGTYTHPGITTHPGVVLRATRVTNIRETGTAFTTAGEEYVAAYFDTDLILDGASAPVPTRRQLGYVKLSVGALGTAAYASLINKVGPMGGPIDTTIAIGGGRQSMRLHRVGIGVAGPDFAMAVWGSLMFPGGGDWSVLETENAVNAPAPVAEDRGLPLIRQGAAGVSTTASYRFADPEDLFDVTTPSRDYGILHSMGTQRAFFRRPRIEATSPNRIVSTERPVLADPMILATAIGPFPRQVDAIPLPTANYALEIRPDGSWRLDAPSTFPAGIGRRTIRTAGTVRSDLDYGTATVTYKLDTADPVPWQFALKNATKIMAHTSMGDVMSMVADIDARAGAATTFADPQLKIGGPFEIVQDLLTILQDLGVPARPDVRMTNKWGLSVGMTIPFVDASGEDFKVIPGEPLPTIKFVDTGMKIELAVAPEADEALLELGGSPMFAIKAIPGLYVVAIIKFKIKLSTETGTTYGFLIGVGIAYSLEAGPFELKGLFAITFFAVFGDTVLGYGVGFLVKLSAELPPIVAIELSLEGKLARLEVQRGLPNETVFQIAKLVFAIEVSVFLVFSISLEIETKKVEVLRGPLLASDAPDVL